MEVLYDDGALSMTMIVRSDERRQAIEALLYEEADYLDRADLDSWIGLYTEDATYWMPVMPDQEDPVNHISLFYDDRVLMEIRRRNMTHPRAPSKDYVVRCSHIISNVRVTAEDEAAGECTVNSNFQCVMYYNDKQTLFAGTYTHKLVAVDGGYMISHKRVDLINCDGVHNSIIIYI